MTASAFRTIVLAPPGEYPGPAPRWPTAEPDDDLDYYLDATAVLADVQEAILSATLAISPWGAGEMTPTDLEVSSGSICSIWLSGGIPGRLYTVKTEATTASGRTFSWPVQIMIDPTLATSPTPAAPNSGFSPPLEWSAVKPMTLTFNLPLSISTAAMIS